VNPARHNGELCATDLDRRAAPRFWSQVVKTDTCWLWRGSRSKDGRGYFHTGAKLYSAHRFAYLLTHGVVPKGHAKHSVILHSCDNPLCVNPAHLFIGTQQENIHDAIRKGRFTHQRKLTPAQVRQIKQMRAAGVTRRECAKQFGAEYSTIRSIDIGRTWSRPDLQPETPNTTEGSAG
jgi:hypothetical protein